MSFRMLGPIALLSLALCGPAAAGTSDVSFTMPVNVTGLPPDINRVAVTCWIDWGPLGVQPRRAEVAVSGGQVATTVTVVVPVDGQTVINANAVGRPAQYHCYLQVHSTNTPGTWYRFNGGSGELAQFRLSPTPTELVGGFVW